MAVDKNNVKRYLLGDASRAESEEIEVRMIEEESFASDISMAESELIEDYLEGTLTDIERELFEKHYLVNEDRRDLVNEMALLKRYSSGSIAAYDPGPETPASRSWNDRLFGMRPLAAGLAVAVLLLLVLGGWQLFRTPTASALERQYAELNRSDLNDLSHYSSTQIAPGSFRNNGTGAKFHVQGPGDGFMFRLPLNFTPEPNSEFQAVLTVSGKPAFTVENARIYKDGNTSEVRVVLPRSVFAKGQCQITLTPKTGGSPIVYNFDAE